MQKNLFLNYAFVLSLFVKSKKNVFFPLLFLWIMKLTFLLSSEKGNLEISP